MTAAIGAAAGAGLIILSLTTTVIYFLIMGAGYLLERITGNRSAGQISVTYPRDARRWPAFYGRFRRTASRWWTSRSTADQSLAPNGPICACQVHRVRQSRDWRSSCQKSKASDCLSRQTKFDDSD